MMEQPQFDRWSRLLSEARSRRQAFAMVFFGVLGIATGQMAPRAVEARKRRTPKGKPKLNRLGCVGVGGACRGHDAVCCSGICEGNKPKKGKKDKRRCIAHNVGGCTVDRNFCFSPALGSCSATAVCLTTIGNAPFCAETEGTSLGINCQPCGKDKDCATLGFGAGSACVVLRTEGACDGCEGINGSTGTACLPPGR